MRTPELWETHSKLKDPGTTGLTLKGKSAIRLTSSKATAWGFLLLFIFGWLVGFCLLACFLACLFVFVFPSHAHLAVISRWMTQVFFLPRPASAISQLLSALQESCLQSREGTWVLPSPGFMLDPCLVISAQRLSSFSPGNAALENSGRSDGREAAA